MAHLIGSWLMFLDPSAINARGVDRGRMSENVTKLKTMIYNGLEIPFASGVSMRRNILNTMKERYSDFKSSKYVKVEGKNATYNKGNPIVIDQDDIFGFFAAKKGKNTYSRKAPLNTSNMLYLTPNKYEDFRVSKQHEGNSVLYGVELAMGAALFKTDIDLGRLGVFHDKDLTGYKNITLDKNDETIKNALMNGAKLYEDEKALVLSYEERIKRLEYILRSIVYLQGGANMTRDYTDISPVIFILYVGKGAGQSLSGAYRLHKKSNSFIIDPDTLYEDYMDNVFDKESNSGNIISKIYVGWRAGYPLGYPGVRRAVLSKLIDLFTEENIFVGTPNKVIDQFMKDIREDWLEPRIEV